MIRKRGVVCGECVCGGGGVKGEGGGGEGGRGTLQQRVSQ
jgi:hypothetical protein